MKRPDELLTTAEAARVAGVSSDCIRWWARSGILPAAVVSRTGTRMFKQVDVERVAGSRRKARTGAVAA
jgi:DNA-binding transcriptional MerR regulator